MCVPARHEGQCPVISGDALERCNSAGYKQKAPTRACPARERKSCVSSALSWDSSSQWMKTNRTSAKHLRQLAQLRAPSFHTIARQCAAIKLATIAP